MFEHFRSKELSNEIWRIKIFASKLKETKKMSIYKPVNRAIGNELGT